MTIWKQLKLTTLNITYILNRQKYNRPPQKINNILMSGEFIIQELHERNITLKAFYFDQFGAMGPQGFSFFYETNNTPTMNNSKKLSSFTDSGLFTYKTNEFDIKHKALFRRANEDWRLLQKDKWFGTTFQILCPSTWSTQYLRTNVNHAILKHLSKSTSRIDKP